MAKEPRLNLIYNIYLSTSFVFIFLKLVAALLILQSSVPSPLELYFNAVSLVSDWMLLTWSLESRAASDIMDRRVHSNDDI
jgi:hypothetical protein